MTIYSYCTNIDWHAGTSDLRVVSVGPADVTVAHGGSTLLTCVARSSRTVHYKWSRDGKPISEDGMSTHSNVLTEMCALLHQSTSLLLLQIHFSPSQHRGCCRYRWQLSHCLESTGVWPLTTTAHSRGYSTSRSTLVGLRMRYRAINILRFSTNRCASV